MYFFLLRDVLVRFLRLKWIFLLGLGFDGSSFSDEEDNFYYELRNMCFGYGEFGSVIYKGNEDFMVDEFNRVCFFFFDCFVFFWCFFDFFFCKRID